MIAENKRLALIDFYLTYTGKVNRKYICNHYGVGTVSASRDLNNYIALYPENLTYDVKQRAYIANPITFTSRYKHNDYNALTFLTSGVWQESIEPSPPLIGLQSKALGSNLVSGVVPAITKAIHQKTHVKVAYASRDSGQTERTIAPHSVFEVSKQWYVRGYDYSRKEFRTFKISRITKFTSENSIIAESESKEFDVQWNSNVLLSIAPKPALSHKEPILFDLGLHDKPVSNLQMNVAIASIWLPEMQIDFSKEGNKELTTHPLILLNRHEVESINGLTYLFS